MNRMATCDGARPMDEKMPISEKRSYTAPSIVLSTISAAMAMGTSRSARPDTEVEETEL